MKPGEFSGTRLSGILDAFATDQVAILENVIGFKKVQPAFEQLVNDLLPQQLVFTPKFQNQQCNLSKTWYQCSE